MIPRWFPRADGKRGRNTALLIGFVGALLVAAINLWAVWRLAFGYRQFGITLSYAFQAGILTGDLGRTVLAIVSAWRFAIGKGLAWGSFVLLLVLLPLGGDFLTAMTPWNIGWIVARFSIAAALIVGIRGAWLMRKSTRTPDYLEVFE